MVKLILLVVVCFAPVLYALETPCKDMTCDSLTVRAILDSNGQQATSVELVSGAMDFRIVSLQFLPNTISKLPKSIGKMVKLYILDVSYNNLTELPVEIGDLPRLNTIILNDNKLTKLTTAIGKLDGLQYIRLENNQLTSLPAEIGLLPLLKMLYLDSNKLTTLPVEIKNDTSLKYLHLTNNLINSLPSSITGLKLAVGEELAGLHIQGNCLSSVTTSIANWINTYNRSHNKDENGEYNNLWKDNQYCGKQRLSVPLYNQSICSERE